jgi:hypothetical protein
MAKINKLITRGEMNLEVALSGHQVSTYRREFGFEQVQLVITIWLLDMAASFNIKNNLTEKQAAEIAAKILRDHWFLKLASVRLFCEKCKDGHFGQNYQTIDRLTILGWLAKFEGELEAYFIEKNDKTPDAEIAKILIHPEVLSALKEAVKDVPKQKKDLQAKLQDPVFRERYYREYILPSQKEKEAADGNPE